MSGDGERLVETVTLSQAKALIRCAAHQQSFLLLSPPGVGKSDMVRQAADEAGLPCRSLLGTQIAPEDVSGVPYIVGERSVFCPPRILLPESPEPFCLFLDELPASAPDIQKAFYSLLLERRLGEHRLPPGTWVVAAGNRGEDRALVRTVSSALVNRVVMLQIRVDQREWLQWAEANHVRREVTGYVSRFPESLQRPLPAVPVPFSTPRSWASLSQALDRAQAAGILDDEVLRSLTAGRISPEDVEPFCAWWRIVARAGETVLNMGLPALRSMSIEKLALSDRAKKSLANAGIASVSDLIARAPDEIQALPDFDAARLQEVEQALSQYGLALLDAANLPAAQPTLTLSKAKSLIRALAHEQSLLLLSPPGVGKSDIVHQAAGEAQMECRSLLGTQIAPEDVSGIPRIVGERSVFCPPRVLLPDDPKRFCLFLDELPACSPDIQKAFYSLLLERRVGEHPLPEQSWVVSAGNRTEDRALVRSMSSALVNRVFMLHLRVDVKEWLVWAKPNGVRSEILAFITYMPTALMRAVPREPRPFSTPRAWVSLSRALDLAERGGALGNETRRALAFGTLSPEDAALYCAMAEESLGELLPLEEYFADPSKLPAADTARWFIIHRLRTLIQRNELPPIPPGQVNGFLEAIPSEFRFAVMIDLVEEWSALGASDAMLNALREVTGL
jgi:MoxR-like ATPase